MTRICFVCHGNICRSTMAEFVFAHMVNEAGLADSIQVDSMGTSTEELGNGPHYGTVRKLREVGVPMYPHRATQVRMGDYGNFDYFIGMDDANIRNLRRIFDGDKEGKVYKLLSFAGKSRDIADPWYTGDFDATYRDVVEGCTALLGWLKV